MKRIMPKIVLFTVLFAALLCVSCVQRVQSTEKAVFPEDPDSIEKAFFTEDPDSIETAAGSVVRLEVYDEHGEKIGKGSGFAAFEPAVLITARHVVVNMDHMTAMRDDGTEFTVDRLLEEDEEFDLAICALPEDAGLPSLQTETASPKRGQKVTAISSQAGLVNLVTLGNVSGLWKKGGRDWILFTAPVSGGSSGGPLINENGAVTGVITGSYDDSQNLNVAAPIEAVKDLYQGIEFKEGR